MLWIVKVLRVYVALLVAAAMGLAPIASAAPTASLSQTQPAAHDTHVQPPSSHCPEPCDDCDQDPASMACQLACAALAWQALPSGVRSQNEKPVASEASGRLATSRSDKSWSPDPPPPKPLQA